MSASPKPTDQLTTFDVFGRRAGASAGAKAVAPERSGHELQRRGLKRLGFSSLSFGGIAILMLLSVALGVAELWQALVVMTPAFIGQVVFFILLGSGVSARFKDPMMTFPQVLFNIALVALAYAVMEVARAVALEAVCLIIAFDVRRLAKRQLLLACAAAMALPAIGVLILSRLQPGSINLSDQLVLVVLGALVFPGLFVAASAGRAMRAQGQRQKQALSEALEQMREMSVRDSLTGLFNRRHLQGLLDDEVRRAHRTGRPFCVAVVDIDHFKRVNDKLGHAVGDLVLQRFAALLVASAQRECDTFARWGGEEFFILLPETTEAEAYVTLRHMQDAIKAYDWARHHALPAVTFSAGVAEYRRQRGLAHTLDAADQALYEAKSMGRDCVEPDSLLSGEQRAALVQSLPARSSVIATGLPVDQLAAPVELFTAPLPPDLSANESATKRVSIKQRLIGLILGADRTLHLPVAFSLIGFVNYTSVIATLLLYTLPKGLISAPVAALFVVLCLIGSWVPYALQRSGATARWKDPMMIVPQMLWPSASLVLAYALIPVGREFALQMLCAVTVFGFVPLKPRQSMLVSLSSPAMLAVAYLGLLAVRPAAFEPLGQGLQVMTTVMVLLLLAFQSMHFALSRERLREERRELREATDRLRELVMHDALTGLPNRQHMQQLLEREYERRNRSGRAFGVALVDLDHFKRINDGHGHPVGDEVLAAFAAAAQAALRETDVIARWGGEEFLVLMTEVGTAQQGLAATERLREQVVSKQLSESVPELSVTFSAGVAVCEAGETLLRLLERADRALYAAKARGRNGCVLDVPVVPTPDAADTPVDAGGAPAAEAERDQLAALAPEGRA